MRAETSSGGAAQFRVRWDKVRAGGRELRGVVATLMPAGIGEDDKGSFSAVKWRFEKDALPVLDELREQFVAGAFINQKEIADHFGKTGPTAKTYIDTGIDLGLWTKEEIGRWFALGKQKRNKEQTQPPVRPDASWENEELSEDEAANVPF